MSQYDKIVFLHISAYIYVNPMIWLADDLKLIKIQNISYRIFLQCIDTCGIARFGTATGCRMNDLGSIAGRGNIFLSPQLADRIWGPPSLLSNVYGGTKGPGCEDDHSPPSSAEMELYLHASCISSWHSA
jgi:hypothetical protein